MQIGSHVRARRNVLGLSQTDLAKELGISHQHVSRIELGDATPSPQTLLRLGNRLGVSTDYLLTGHEQAPLDAAGAIRSEPHISAAAKRHLVGVLEELRAKG
ncbi:MAG: helix-turn-helix domain-containing protein [Solirubrobacteraceae bacterium]